MTKFSMRRYVLIALLALSVVVCVPYAVRRLRMTKADVLLTEADALSWNNQWIAAAPLYEEAEHEFIKEHRPGLALYANVSQFIPRAESEDIPELLVQLQEDLNVPAAQEPETRLRILTIKGMIEVNYDAGAARQTWREVAILARELHHYLLASRAAGEEGIAAFLLGDISTAKSKVVLAWAVARYLQDPAARVRYASVYGAGLNAIHRYKEALVPLDEAINTAQNTKGIAYPTIALNEKIDSFRGLHRYNEALALTDEGIRRLPPLHLDAHLFQLFTLKGEVYDDMGQVDSATAQYEEALRRARRLKMWRGITQTGGLLARVYERQGELPRALAAVNEAIAANTQIPQELFYMPRNLAIKAEIERKMGRSAMSYELYRQSETLIDSLISKASTRNIERLLLSQMSDVYAGHFGSLVSEGNYSDAFEIIEKARGRVETQALEHHETTAPHRATPEEQELTKLNLELINTDDPHRREVISKRIYDAELHLDDTTPAGQTAVHPVSLKRLQHDMGPSQLLIEYVLADPESYALAITRETVHSYTLPGRETIETDVSQYRKELSTQKTDDVLGQRLYAELLERIPEMSAKTSVTIVPDGGMHLLPFSALVHDGKYLLATHAISTSPSATVLHIVQAAGLNRIVNSRPYLGVAAWTTAEINKSSVMRLITGPARSELVALPESKREVETIASDLPKPSTLLIGPAATETEFKRLPLHQYNVVHLALHGYADMEYPDRSALMFAPPSGGHAEDDGMLQVREIRDLHINAKLVTLSACDTGVGPAAAASGVTNIVNSFMEAGAASVVATLWELEDHSTRELMAAFYDHLSHHESKSAALRAAQLSLLQRGAAPYYWASFELVGDPLGSI